MNKTLANGNPYNKIEQGIYQQEQPLIWRLQEIVPAILNNRPVEARKGN